VVRLVLTGGSLTQRPKRPLRCLLVEVPWQIKKYLNLPKVKYNSLYGLIYSIGYLTSLCRRPSGKHACLVCQRSVIHISGQPNLTQHCKQFSTALTPASTTLPWRYVAEMGSAYSLHVSAKYGEYNESFQVKRKWNSRLKWNKNNYNQTLHALLLLKVEKSSQIPTWPNGSERILGFCRYEPVETFVYY